MASVALASFTDDDLRQALQTEDRTPPPPQQKLSTRVPPWGWAVVVLGVVVVTAALIALPILFTRHPRPTVTATPTPTPTPSSTPQFPTVDPSAVRAQVTLPPSDGLSKAAYQVTAAQNHQLGLLACGQSSQSAFYVIDLADPAVSAPAVLLGPGTITSAANAYLNGGRMLAASADGTVWSQCTGSLASATVACATVTWPSLSDLNPVLFAGSQWVGQPTDVVCALNAAQRLTVQNQAAVVCENTPALPGTAADRTTTVYTTGTTYVLFGVVNTANNSLNYVFYNDPSAPVCSTLYTLPFDATAERLLFADLTYDGLLLLVLTSERVLCYGRPSGLATFVVQDTFAWNGSDATQCALDRLHAVSAGGEVWCLLNSATSASLLVPFNLATQRFALARGREVPAPSAGFLDTAGATAVYADAARNQVVLVQADTTSHVAVTWVALTGF